MLAQLKLRKSIFVAALLTNTVLVYLLGGELSAAVYLVLVAGEAVFFPLYVWKRRFTFNASIFFTWLSLILLGATALMSYSSIRKVAPLEIIKTQISSTVDQFEGMSGTKIEDSDLPPELLKEKVLVEFPSAVAILVLVFVVVNSVMFLRLNPIISHIQLGLEPSFFRKWKAPELLVWPTILLGGLMIFDLGVVSDVSLNFFKILLAIYTMQGVCILAFFFDQWKVGPFLRAAFYVLALSLAMPIVSGMGFFDLWFDFRSRLRQR